MTVVMRNTKTSEIRVLSGDSQSPEYRNLIRQRTTNDRPLWEETGMHHAVALSDRIAKDAIAPEDIGDEGQPFRSVSGNPPDVELTPSSVVDRGMPSFTEMQGDAGRAISIDEDEEFVPTVMGGATRRAGEADGTGSLEDGEETPPLVNPDQASTAVTSESQHRTAMAEDEMDDEGDGPDGDPDGEDEDDSENEALIAFLVENNREVDLEAMAEAAGVPQSGSKPEVATRLVEHGKVPEDQLTAFRAQQS